MEIMNHQYFRYIIKNMKQTNKNKDTLIKKENNHK
jgi:hypothetical protein